MIKSWIKSTLGERNLGVWDYYRYPELRNLWGGGFNGQLGRRRIVADLCESVNFAYAVETGTFRGATTEILANSIAGEIYTIEKLPRNFGFAKHRLNKYRWVHVEEGDSRSFLKALFANNKLPVNQPGFYYLDAHWEADLPLVEEIDIVFSNTDHAVVMIDDFQVPGDCGYQFDNYGTGKILTATLLEEAVAKFDLNLFYPRLPSSLETSVKRGCAVLVKRGDESLVEVPSLVSYSA